MSDVTVLIAKHAVLSIGVVNAMFIFQFKLSSLIDKEVGAGVAQLV
jgi:hypothetical protein